MDIAIRKAHEKIMRLTQDKDALHSYHMRQMAIYDYNTSVSAAEKRGREEGIAIGKQKAKEDIAIGEQRGIILERCRIVLNMKRLGFSTQEIAKFIGKTLEEVEVAINSKNVYGN
jgi:predicted transposase YdaD